MLKSCKLFSPTPSNPPLEKKGRAFFHRRLKPTAMNIRKREFTLKSCKLFSATPPNSPLEKKGRAFIILSFPRASGGNPLYLIRVISFE